MRSAAVESCASPPPYAAVMDVTGDAAGREHAVASRRAKVESRIVQWYQVSYERMPALPSFTLAKDLRHSIRGGHPWIFDRALARGHAPVAPGQLVRIAYGGEALAVGYADPGRPIAVRVLEREPAPTLDDIWVAERARAAASCRTADPRLANTDAVRVIHGENDYMPGLVVDLYRDTAALVFDGPGAHAWWSPHVPAVLDGIRAAGFSVARAWARANHMHGANARVNLGLLAGSPPAEPITVVREYQARFEVDLESGHKTGLFLDQRENRRLTGELAAGARVLDVYSYTGGFAVHAALGGAREVTVVDSARPAVEAARRNFALSGLEPAGHRFVCADAFTFLADAAERGERFELIVVDPPSFAPSERARPRALDAYRSLQRAALALCEPGGFLMSASCSSHVSTRDLMAALDRAARDAGRRIRVLEVRGAASDHPVLPCFPEGDYLSFLMVAVE